MGHDRHGGAGATPLPPDGHPAALPVESRRGMERAAAGCHRLRVVAPAVGRDRAVMVFTIILYGIVCAPFLSIDVCVCVCFFFVYVTPCL